MPKTNKEIWKCEICGKELDSQKAEDLHVTLMHKCPFCKHLFWLYGYEMLCDIQTPGIDPAKCRFEEKK